MELDQEVVKTIESQIEENSVLLYMKGSPQMPQCGFSSRTVEALKSCGHEFAYVNVLMDPEVFENLAHYADWPTFPQLYIDGEPNLNSVSAVCALKGVPLGRNTKQ